MAISTYQVYLMYKATAEGAWAKLIDIVDYPDLKGDPQMIDTTTLSDGEETQIPGIRAAESRQFTANYTKADYIKVKALEGQDIPYAVYFGGDSSGVPDGHNGQFEGVGMVSVTPLGAGTNDVVRMRLTMAMSVPFEEASAS